MCRWWRVSCGSAHFVTLLAAAAIVLKGTTRVVVRLAVVFSESSMVLPALEQLCALLAPVRLTGTGGRPHAFRWRSRHGPAGAG